MNKRTELFPIDSLHFELTSHCNMKCAHCYNNSGINNTIQDPMTSQKWIDFAKYLVNKGGVYETILSGGEPFLLGDTVIEIMDILNEVGQKRWFSLLTNGYFLTDERVSRLRKFRYHWLQISIDGSTPEYHDKFRNLQGSWEKAVNAAKKVSMSGIPLKIAHCVTPYNIEKIDDMYRLAYSLGASEIITGRISYSGRASINTKYLLSYEEEQYLEAKIKENAAKYNKKMIVKNANTVKVGLERHRKNPRSCAVIRPNGDIRIDGMAPFVIGNILVDDFAVIWKNKIKDAWNNEKVTKFISEFDENDINYESVNYIMDDIII
ncbi:radical SAM/SPASM domain-containing protein [Blautia sp. MSJ-9]|uniref:radical SAM/SPASM domain-containing protein n=1 Tax=Blautia sp. MSJ-9 TaxID=2841511 RepID=UPI0020A1DD32|nr:radical SAM protein [Blautia sp. MSJ-9]